MYNFDEIIDRRNTNRMPTDIDYQIAAMEMIGG